ncbi:MULTISPECIES: outer membrane protein [unclassified Phyllobacterium]|uniref:outer membrane protein n=1 Tax=unclassified Phyllobacterium TaxID=2638441 RepID=UPI003012F926
MIKTVFALASLATVAGLPAQAADLGSPDYPAQVESTPFNWSGFYAGVNAGYAFGGDGDVNSSGQLGPNIANIATGARPGSIELDRNGFIGGAQIGYNWQTGRYVYGLEADISFADVNDTGNFVTPQINTGLAQGNVFKSELDYLGTVRARAGYAFDRTLVYGTGGLAFGRTTQSVDMFAPTGVKQFTDEKEETKFGYAVGAGAEYAITQHLTFKTEYLYYDLGSESLDVSAIAGTGVVGGYNSKFENDGHILRVGINYKF